MVKCHCAKIAVFNISGETKGRFCVSQLITFPLTICKSSFLVDVNSV